MEEEHLRAGVEALEDDLRQLGLYARDTRAVQSESGDTFVLFDCLVGDVAFSDRVQNPQAAEMTTDFRKMQVESERDLTNRTRDELMDRLRKGESIFEED